MSKEKEDKMVPPTWRPSDIKYEDWRFHVELELKHWISVRKKKKVRDTFCLKNFVM